jgi:3-phenylpropionate/trans-cinnamate dioxygenase ferredoxin reductase subunit
MMSGQLYTYVIVGGGLAGASAVQGIRERDENGSVLLIGGEKHLPYDRPPLSKKLWFGKKKVEEIFVHDQEFYDQNGVELALSTKAVALDANQKTVTDDKGKGYRYKRLLLATGGTPRSLPIPGGDLDGLYYYRYLDDYLRMRREAAAGKSALVIGGGFIGSEMAAALNVNELKVTMIFPESYLVQRVFPDYLGQAIQQHYLERGVKILTGDVPASLTRKGSTFITQTENGEQIESDLVVIGIGIVPAVELAEGAGLQTGNGTLVNEYLQTSHPDIYAAGDNALFPYQALEQQMRIEHWDNALNQGKWAGRNMAGAHEPFTYMPYFYSDLFEFGYEAVGDVNAELETFADWQKENDTGVIYYLKDGKVRGAMMCNVWGKLDAARELIRKGERVTPEDLRGAIG